MNILALDTAMEILSVALSCESGLWYTEADAGSRHSELLMECVDSLCKRANIAPCKLDRIACMQGPGSFTGLRIGFSVAKGLALALGIPFSAVPTLDCIAYPLSCCPGIIVPAIDAKKGCFFTALYREEQRLTDYLDAEPETIAEEIARQQSSDHDPIILSGSGADLLSSRLSPDFPNRINVDPNARKGAAKELIKIVKGTIIPVDTSASMKNAIALQPVYLRKSDAELHAKK